MIVCKKCGYDVYVQQRAGQLVRISTPYYCADCECFKNYSEVTYIK